MTDLYFFTAAWLFSLQAVFEPTADLRCTNTRGRFSSEDQQSVNLRSGTDLTDGP